MSEAKNESSANGATLSVELEVIRLRKEVTRLNECLHRKNVALDAMQWVWCDGGCRTGVNRYAPAELSQEMVEAAERNTERLRKWFENAQFKRKWAAMSEQERNAWFSDRASNARIEPNRTR